MFYQRFLFLCEASHIAPSSAATQAGFNRGTVSVWKKKYEAGQDVTPDQDIINKICAFFGCTEQWLRGISESKQKEPATTEGSGLSLKEMDYIKLLRRLTPEQLARQIEILQDIVGK